jgi:hypothetical protein
VHRGELDARERERHDLHLERDTGDIGVRAGEGTQWRGPGVEHRDGPGSAGVRIESTRRVRDADQRHQVQALEGNPAYIATGVAFPYVSQVEAGDLRHGHRHRIPGGQHRLLCAGPPARRRTGTTGHQPAQGSPQSPWWRHGGNQPALVTSVSGPVGTWLELGGVGESRNQDAQEYTRSRRTRDRQEEQLWFRVEVLD